MDRVKRYKIHFFLFVIFMAFVFIGPYYFLSYKPQEMTYNRSEKSQQWTGVITFWDFPRLDKKTGGQYNWINEKIRSFERANPGVYIDFQPLDWEKGAIKLDAALKLGNLPDIIPVGSNYTIISQDVLEPLDKYFSLDELKDFKEEALRAVTYNGEILAMPWMMTTYSLILNLDLFSKRGVEPPLDGYWTYEEFIDKLQQLTFDSRGRGKIDHYGFNSSVQAGYYNIWGIILSDGGRVIDDKLDFVFNDEAAYSGVEKVIDMKQKYGVTHPTFGENTSNEAWTTFYRDKNVAVIPAGTWSLNVLERLRNEGKGFNYAVAHYPTGTLGNPVSMSNTVGSYGISKQEDPEKLEVCVAFLKYLIKDEYQNQLNRLGVFPVKKSLGNLYVDDPNMSLIYESLENTIIIPPHPYWNDIDEILQKEIQQGVLGKKDIKRVMEDGEEKVNSLVNLKGRY
ncbi:extracellular solute-binding protein [Alkaliphilus peptidifermentans]|uniref:Carbohydrate ABC transporter substrate-binding protein, CUT1 family n=1 Tax=Alkaliphilus peptidifermentans DSM 18978 TaxID=1120976 RepID=A0A1G5KYN1_9FIRM|nr:extracellular solute-binding protein [Alkaliphilus peptidifermentans]SCZ05190.1 carbohydrate ABC transporter substrate-binding protein, CUT1 family [Alkaliphilus peptidifermentans DSM 18978]